MAFSAYIFKSNKLTRGERMRLVREVVEKSVAKSCPGKVVTNNADKGAANQGTTLCVASAGQLVSHAHEQVNVFHRLVSLFKLINALEKEMVDILVAL